MVKFSVFIGKLKALLQSFFLGLADYVCIRKLKLKTLLQSFLLSLAHYVCIRKLKLKTLLQSFLLSVAHYVCIRKLKTPLQTKSDTQADLYDFKVDHELLEAIGLVKLQWLKPLNTR